ncbi:MAG: hypothetical protein QXM43_01405, partial [Desulfurococcaceae archaeon]
MDLKLAWVAVAVALLAALFAALLKRREGGAVKLVVFPAKPMERVFKDTPPPGEVQPFRLSAVRNEYVGSMFGVWSSEAVKGLRLETTDLVSERGRIDSRNVKAFFVGSIPLTFNSPAPAEELERRAPCEIPDPIL